MTSSKISNTYVYDIFAYVLWKFRVIVNGNNNAPKKDLAYLQQEIGDIIITYQVLTRELFRRYLSQHGAWVRRVPAEACSGLVKEVLAVGVLDGFDTIFCAAALVLETFLFLQGERHVFPWSFADAFADILRQTLEEPLTEEILTTDGKNFRKVIQELLQSKSLTLEDFFTDESAGLDSPPDYDSAPYRRKGRSTTQCAVPSRTVRPRVAKDENGRWRTVVQGGDFRQEVHVQICEKSHECSRYCFQMYSQVPLVSIDANGDVTKNNFWIPSSCRCLIEARNDYENELYS